MDTKHKIFVIIVSCIVLGGASYGGYSLFAERDPQIVNTITSLGAPPTRGSKDFKYSETDDTEAPAASVPAKNSNSNSPVEQNPAPAPATSQPTSSQPTYTYKNGTYNSQVSYVVPNGSNMMYVTLTVDNDFITAVTAGHNPEIPSRSLSFITDFESQIGSAVVGKNLANVSPSRIAGASLTTDGFNAAVTIIRNDAR